MSKHSLSAYRIVLRMRTARTLLVEGDTDKTVIQRLLLEQPAEERPISSRPVIDTPTLLSDEALSGLGHKDQVKLIAESCASDASRFMALIDREWEDFNSNSMELTVHDHEYRAMTTTLVKTFGHSIENYFFDSSIFTSLLCRQFPGDMNNGIRRLIRELFPKACELALIYSLTAKDMQLISRLTGLISRRHIELEENRFTINEIFFRDLQGRSAEIEQVASFSTRLNDIQTKVTNRSPDSTTTKWANHGHLGGEAIWACIAKVLERSGVSNDICDQVERGMRNDKLKHGADIIAAGPHERRPLEWLARWLLDLEGVQLA